jgi:hypothetical protein
VVASFCPLALPCQNSKVFGTGFGRRGAGRAGGNTSGFLLLASCRPNDSNASAGRRGALPLLTWRRNAPGSPPLTTMLRRGMAPAVSAAAVARRRGQRLVRESAAHRQARSFGAALRRRNATGSTLRQPTAAPLFPSPRWLGGGAATFGRHRVRRPTPPGRVAAGKEKLVGTAARARPVIEPDRQVEQEIA